MAKIGIFFGIDISRDKFTVACRSGNTIKVHDWTYDCDGIKGFVRGLASDSKCVMEATGIYHTRLAVALHDAGIFVSVVNPLCIKNYSRMLMKRTKTDKADSSLILDYAESQALEEWKPKETYCIEVHQLFTMLESKRKQLSIAMNKLESLEHSGCKSKLCVDMCKRDMIDFKNDIELISNEIAKLVEANEKESLERVMSIPGIGRTTACMLIALTNTMRGFDNYRQVISYIGTSPRIYESGKSICGRAAICKMGMGLVRKQLYMCTFSAERYNRSCTELAERLREKGKANKVIRIALVNKLIKQIFAIMTGNKMYDENFSKNIW